MLTITVFVPSFQSLEDIVKVERNTFSVESADVLLGPPRGMFVGRWGVVRPNKHIR